MYIATIDAGTTNTRVRIWKGGEPVCESSAMTGVRDTAMDGNNARLTAAIKGCLEDALRAAGLTQGELTLILASGMLTSNVGLLEIPHVKAPVDIDGLAAHMVERQMPSICRRPIWFVPGVKNTDQKLPPSRIEEMDIMRGEEVEVFGLMARLRLSGPAIVILPGSHNKFILVNQAAQIVGCMTTLAGELLYVLSHHTILADAVDHGFADALDAAAFQEGVDCCRKLGLGRAAFAVRVLNLFAGFSAQQCRSYLLGIVLADDVRALLSSHLFENVGKIPVVIAGKPIMQQGLQSLISASFPQIILADAPMQANLSGYGAIAVAQKRGLCK